ncbi:HNH endonuclease [Streptosporangium vulgare]|uniref:HNH endonuclease n=1 Tax=Streptosporangium vulgare TaxID=46190 RepID=A0ABV5TQ06_9ACTN
MSTLDVAGRANPSQPVCAFARCSRLAIADGVCGFHSQRSAICPEETCDRPVSCQGRCDAHYRQFRKTGKTQKLRDRSGNGRIVDGNGYIIVKRPDHPEARKNGWVSEHRMVMSDHLGRPLWPDEYVHHKNGNRVDNRLENLELWSGSQPPGQRIVDKLIWAREIIERYGSHPEFSP